MHTAICGSQTAIFYVVQSTEGSECTYYSNLRDIHGLLQHKINGAISCKTSRKKQISQRFLFFYIINHNGHEDEEWGDFVLGH